MQSTHFTRLTFLLLCSFAAQCAAETVSTEDTKPNSAKSTESAPKTPRAAEPNPPVITAEDPKPIVPVAKPQPKPNPPVALFDGKTLEGWRGYRLQATDGWSVADGVLTFSGTGDDIVTKKEFQNFELEFEFKSEAKTNSGVYYRVRLGDRKPYMSGPEYQISSATNPEEQDLILRGTGALHALYPTQLGLEKPVGEWNNAKIVIRGERFEHWLNGTKVVDVDTSTEEFKTTLKTSKFNGWPQFNQTKKGRIGLQGYGQSVWLRNITIRELPK